MEKNKVKFSLTKHTKKGPFRFMGYGEIDENNLYYNGKTYEDCISCCHKIFNKDNEYKGSFFHFETIEFVNNRNQNDDMEIEIDYDLWFRILN